MEEFAYNFVYDMVKKSEYCCKITKEKSKKIFFITVKEFATNSTKITVSS